MDALVMAGGHGNRLGKGEKPLIDLCGKPMISYVLNALCQSERVDKIFIATSPHTPETKKHLENVNYRVIETMGRGYIPDLIEATETLGLRYPF
ncbi:MAG: NTP transferase domain-containing protein, partial [Methanocellales archaeon]|nr:NTP transferase domain-containing protein [Methanocellales archaeon]